MSEQPAAEVQEHHETAKAENSGNEPGPRQTRNRRRPYRKNNRYSPAVYKVVYVKKGEGEEVVVPGQENKRESEQERRNPRGDGGRQQKRQNLKPNKPQNRGESREQGGENAEQPRERAEKSSGNRRNNKVPAKPQENRQQAEGEGANRPRTAGPPKKINSKYLSMNRYSDPAECHQVILRNLANYRDKVEVFGSGARIEDLLSLHLDYNEFYKLMRLSKAGRARLRLSFERQNDFFEALKNNNLFAELFANEKPLRYPDNFSNKETSHFLGRKVRIAVFRGSLLTEDTDAIVNYTDRELNHGFGLALEIFNAAGEPAFQEALGELRKREKIEGGDAVISSNGHIAHLKKIIHVVVPDLNGERVDSEARVSNMIKNILKEAENSHLNSVSLCILSSGDDKLTELRSAELTVAALDAHFKGKSNSSLGHVRLTSSSDNTLHKLGELLSNLSVVEPKQQMKEEEYIPPTADK